MASSDQTAGVFDNIQSKLCSRCTTRKTLGEFIRFHGSREKEFAICNSCSEKKKGKRPLRSNEDNEAQPEYALDENSDLEEEINNDEDKVTYELAELEEIVARYFTNIEENTEVNFSETLELEDELIDNFNNDHDTTEEDKFRNIIYFFLLPIEAGSRYYWEIRKIYCRKNNTGQATVYLGCAQRMDRKSIRPENRPTKRISEARPPIERYPCKGKIAITIDINIRQAKVKIKHLISHERPTYRENNLPENAITWIFNNLNRNLRKVDVYKRLCEEGLVDSTIHTYRQVYYWASKFSAQQYVTNASNQLISSLNFLKQNELIDEGYKVMLYVENDFVRALGFLTPFNGHIRRDDINEIIIDSTFKTNQEKFELFAVIINCGGYGVPLAYLYVDTFTAPDDRLQDPRNTINSRAKVLKEFFLSLRRGGILPTFVLVDKDAGQIAAIQEAWSWTANIQLCLWHVKHAIDRKLRDKKYKSSQYTARKAKEANEQFRFIDASWIPGDSEGITYQQDKIKEVLNMVKRHATLHPLIPISKEIFLTSMEIYHQSVEEMYRYCKEDNLVHLWAYLWINWYNKSDWNLFARASYPKAIPLARTTMLVESHWHVIKYNYKYNCNRPCLDRLTQILTRELIPDQIINCKRLNNHRAFPSWWGAFKNEWKIALDKDIGSEDNYLTDVSNWICSCPAFISNTFLVCKHIVKACRDRNPSFFPQYATTW